MLNWNDLKIVLAIKRHQTFAAAGKRLRLNQTTVARRLSSIEEALDARLFHRHDRDLLATEIGEQVCLHAERVEAEFNALQQKVLGTDSRPEGDIRLTTTPLLLEYLLLPHLKPFLRQYPAIHWEFISDSNDLSLSKREADIALRLARPNEGKAITRRLGQIDYAVYAHRDIADKKPRWIAYSKDKLYLPLAAEAERLTVAD